MESKLQNMKKMCNELCENTNEIDTFGFHKMMMNIAEVNLEMILQFKRSVLPKLHSMASEFQLVKQELGVAKHALIEKEEELKNGKSCIKCPSLQKELEVLQKKQAVNESRIKSIAKILTRNVPTSQNFQSKTDDNGKDNDPSTITKAYSLVSQMLGCDPISSDDETETNEKDLRKKSPLSDQNINLLTEKENSDVRNSSKSVETDSDSDILIVTLESTGKENYNQMSLSPTQVLVGEDKLCGSPVLGKSKKTSITSLTDSPEISKLKWEDQIHENTNCIPPTPGKNSLKKQNNNAKTTFSHLQSENCKIDGLVDSRSKHDNPSRGNSKRAASFWQLKPSTTIDKNDITKDSFKLRQAKLYLGCAPKKLDLCDLEEFNGGIRKSQTSTQISDDKLSQCCSSRSKTEKSYLMKADMCNLEEFNRGIHENQTSTQMTDGKQSHSLLEGNIVKDLNEDVVEDSPISTMSGSKRKGGRPFNLGRKLSYDSGTGVGQPSGENRKSFGSQNELHVSEEVAKCNDSFDCIKKVAVSPKYKYRDGPVRKKSDRQQLSGWDCENCKKYFEAAGGPNMTEEELKKIRDRCSRHRDKNPTRLQTPPGFWDVEFPPTPVCAELDKTHADILPLTKRKRK